MKRVWCLYRVSTEKQLYKDTTKGDVDIPTQRNACHTFAASKSDWKITKEIIAKGISGWKTRTEDRNDLMEIKIGAKRKEFDVLLVFMFDRIGRREDETPFVVEFLVKHGIEVWSVQEGQQDIKTHTDKLLNYITFWSSAGESLKISERVKNAYRVLNEQGRYVSGEPPYGYEKYDTGIPHPKIKNKTLLGLRINPNEVDFVKTVFDLYVNKGLGGIRLANYLNTKTDFKRRNGKPFTGEQINKIIRNPIYIGRKPYNKEDRPINEWKLQDYNPDLHIIDEELWKKAQELANKRKNHQKYDPLLTHSQLLLSGIVFCGYCGAKLTVSHSLRQYTTKKGEIKRQAIKRYTCQNAKYIHFKNIHECTTFGGKTYDTKVVEILKDIVRNSSQMILPNNIENYVKSSIKDKTKELKKLQRQYNECQIEYEALKKELPKVLLGKSKFSEELLSELITNKEKELVEIAEKINEIEASIENSKLEIQKYIDLKSDLKNWDVLFDNADHDTKKVMIARIVHKIYFRKEKIDIELNQNLQQLLKLCSA